ncbi:phosphatidylinositol N-acetylglucosaminyltransferase gpi19 [Yamadazyma tenuis]|uniref:PIG-P-domain-containing protein n=1 Tax=Candida tenuis (strain ATCC 10573 / BCRC 21748 / CBS 615 / JCM 9827 / NBRC 10315 / NRRL Y-1498 / VKM Y-70) TaxID=590646 RepID=G3BB32_CANTC|nr:PIG-P-domain-containing protein [Yamadazyma tenuis ATCC 10573]EGV62129.1 PIG-P-domain-containing protein [Yamadazyma tenuis ATCC 10573]WEJ93385.1 phosphatidylinositol N-acetylglucosaminyltransferase gpi19 [Yamadazyma tenuis]
MADLSTTEDSLARQSDVTVSNQNPELAEYVGFSTSVVSAVLLSCFVLWCFVPTEFFVQHLGFDYFPDKYWTSAVPAFFLMAMLFSYVGHTLYEVEIKTLQLNDIRNFIDEHSVMPGSEKYDFETMNAEMAQYIHKSPSGVCDLPVTIANEVLYGDYEEDFDELD